MHKNTASFLSEFTKIRMFAKVGVHGDPIFKDTIFATSWGEAIDFSGAQEYEDSALEASNQLTLYLHKNHRDEYRGWNEKAKAIEREVKKTIEHAIANAITNGRAPKDIPKKNIHWDVFYICMSLEYSDFYQSEYYAQLAYWYLNEHFPCGWVGEVPEDFVGAFELGKLVVF